MKGSTFERDQEDEIRISTREKLQINFFIQRPFDECFLDDEKNDIVIQKFKLNSFPINTVKLGEVPLHFSLTKKHDLFSEAINEFYSAQKKKKSCTVFDLFSKQEFSFPKSIIEKKSLPTITSIIINNEEKKDNLTGLTVVNKRKMCKCYKSNCLKNYCECFNAGIMCMNGCLCKNCLNTKDHSEIRNQALMKFRKYT